MDTNKEKLIELYNQMYNHTKSKCKPSRCKHLSKTRCCSPEYCEDVIGYAKDRWDIYLQITDHKSLPLMGPEGCIVEPYLRPSCTLHDCLINSLGFDPEDEEWTIQYFKLRGQINELEMEMRNNDISNDTF